tara:strand:- start:3540 stop:3839 length:300 start_codon:yes stop_codon:yes gene_type:complete
MTMMQLSNRNMRAIDRLFDRMTGFSGMSSPLQVVDAWFDNLERDVKIANGPADGIVTRYEMVAKTYKREVNENGDVIFRLLTDDEVKALETNQSEDAKS